MLLRLRKECIIPEQMKTAINFLKHIYSESVPDVANILVAEADGDVETIKSYLMGVRDYIDKLLSEIS